MTIEVKWSIIAVVAVLLDVSWELRPDAHCSLSCHLSVNGQCVVYLVAFFPSRGPFRAACVFIIPLKYCQQSHTQLDLQWICSDIIYRAYVSFSDKTLLFNNLCTICACLVGSGRPRTGIGSKLRWGNRLCVCVCVCDVMWCDVAYYRTRIQCKQIRNFRRWNTAPVSSATFSTAAKDRLEKMKPTFVAIQVMIRLNCVAPNAGSLRPYRIKHPI
jgi:hypothetical protein